MASVVSAAIRGLGNKYSDGTERIEIHIPSDLAHGLPYSHDTRVSVLLKVGVHSCHAGLRATRNNNYVWICPNVKALNGTKMRLADLVAEAGFQKNDRVILSVDGNDIVLKQDLGISGGKESKSVGEINA